MKRRSKRYISRAADVVEEQARSMEVHGQGGTS